MGFNIPTRCRKVGVILTCFVNGRKRFRAVAFPVEPDQHDVSRVRAAVESMPRPTPPASAGL